MGKSNGPGDRAGRCDEVAAVLVVAVVSPTSRAMEKLVDDLTGGGGVAGGLLSSLTDVDVVDVATALSSSVMFSDECDELALSGRIFLHPVSAKFNQAELANDRLLADGRIL